MKVTLSQRNSVVKLIGVFSGMSQHQIYANYYRVGVEMAGHMWRNVLRRIGDWAHRTAGTGQQGEARPITAETRGEGTTGGIGGEQPLRSDGGGSKIESEASVSPDSGPAPTGPYAEREQPITAFPKNFHQILHLTKSPLFVTDAEGNALVWNEGMTELTGSTEEEAKAADRLSSVWYHDGRRAKTLADKIVDTHQGRREDATPTHVEYDVEKVGWVDFELYQDESTFADADGETRHIRFSAAPMYEDDEFIGVVEYVEDRTEDVQKRHELEDLLDELIETLNGVQEGDLSVRAEAPSLGHVDTSFGAVVDSLNETLSTLEPIANGLAEDSERLRRSTTDIAEQTDSITDAAQEQESSLQKVSDEIDNVSASVEEIASTAQDVSNNAATAVEQAEEGDEQARETEATIAEVADATDTVVEDVRSLQERVAEIDEIIDMIDDIAEQTNMLALNASIEAARAGEAGEGFAVVADEIKQLANESQEHADTIETQLRSIQENTDQTVEQLDSVSAMVHDSRDQVQTVQRSIDTVVTEMDRTADGIQQVAAVTDDQAASAEEIAARIDGVVDSAEQVATSVTEISDRNTEHAELADRIDQNIEQLTGDHD